MEYFTQYHQQPSYSCWFTGWFLSADTSTKKPLGIYTPTGAPKKGQLA